MSMAKKVKLVVWGVPTIEGDADNLTLKLPTYRLQRDGKYQNWRGEVELDISRYFVKQFMTAVAAMQERDRARLARERDRLTSELAPVQIPPGTSQE